MEDRDRDKISKNTGSTSSNIGQKKSDSSVEFGEKVGRSEKIEHEHTSSDEGESGVRYRGGNRGGNSEEL